MPPKVDPRNAPRAVDLCFAIDATGSMGPYIDAVTDNINAMVKQIKAGSKILNITPDLKVAVVAFRDNDPHSSKIGDGFVGAFKVVINFTDKIDDVEKKLYNLRAVGGGDGAEAVLTAIQNALPNDKDIQKQKLNWRSSTQNGNSNNRILILITDAPPHGVELLSKYDANPRWEGISPTGIKDPIIDSNTRIFVLKCLPEMEHYDIAEHYYDWLVKRLPDDPLSPAVPTNKLPPNGASIRLSLAKNLATIVVAITLEGMRIREAADDLLLDDLLADGITPRSNAVLPQLLSFIATGVNNKMNKNVQTTADAIKEVKKHFSGTKFPSLDNSLHTKSSALVEEHNVALWERVASGESMDILQGLKPYDRGDFDNQTVGYEYGPMNDYHVMALAGMYSSARGDKGGVRGVKGDNDDNGGEGEAAGEEANEADEGEAAEEEAGDDRDEDETKDGVDNDEEEDRPWLRFK